MPKVIFALVIILVSTKLMAQDKITIYDPNADAAEQLNQAIEQAQQQNKHILIQIGGNWCSWCIKLHKFINAHHQLDSIIHADYVPVKLNYSKENKNLEVLDKLEHPQRFGFPVLVVLDETGRRIHTQDTGILESHSSYDAEKIERFLKLWNHQAVNR